LKLPLIRGGETIKGMSLAIKSERLAVLIRSIVYAKRSEKLFRLLQINSAVLNALLTSKLGLRVAVGGSLDYTQFILIVAPAAAGGFLVGGLTVSLASVFLPLAIIYGRAIEEIPDPYEKCKLLCKFAEKFHNKQLVIEMTKVNSLVENTATVLQLPVDKVPLPLVCVEEKLSLLQRYKLKELVRSDKARKRVQYFSEFIKKFPECDVDPEVGYEEIVEKIIK
jgi:hypothetical protein